MTKFIQQLRIHDRSTADLLATLEQLTGNQGIDIVISTELEQLLRTTLVSLGLDPKDTTASELYLALESKMLRDGKEFLQHLKVEGKTENEFADAIVDQCNTLFTNKTVLVPKNSVIKRILKENPPKAALKLLHFRSVESLLRRCALPVVVAACELTESKKWRQQFMHKIDLLESNDFEQQKVAFHSVPAEKWRHLHRALLERSGHSVFRVNIAGGIVIVPADKIITESSAVLLTMATLSALAKLRAHASFTPRILLDSSVPTTVSEHMYDQDGGHVIVRGVQFGWKEVHHHMAVNQKVRELFEPHITDSTVSGDDTEQLLSAFNPIFAWWTSRLALGYSDGNVVVSCNLYDVSRNASFKRPLGKHTTLAFNRELDTTLRLRFLKEQQLSNRIYDQLNAATDFDSDPLMLELDEIV